MRNICAFDGKEFEATRADARYCSATCRAKASKARRREEGVDTAVQVVDTSTATPDAEDRPPEQPSENDTRLVEIERRLADLEEDFDLAEKRNLSRPSDKQLVELVRREMKALVAPVLNRLQAVEKLADQLQCAIGTMTQELGALRVFSVEETERVDEIEQAVITLAHRVTALGSDLEELVQGIASIDTEAPSAGRRVRHG